MRSSRPVSPGKRSSNSVRPAVLAQRPEARVEDAAVQALPFLAGKAAHVRFFARVVVAVAEVDLPCCGLARCRAGTIRGVRAAARRVVGGAENDRHLVDLEVAPAGDERKHAARQPERQPLRRLLVVAGVPEELPCVGKFVADIEEVPPVAGQMPLSARVRRAAQRLPAFARGVAEAEHGVRKCVKVEVVVLRRQFDAQAALWVPKTYATRQYS